MVDEIPKNFNGYVFQDGRCVSIEDADTIYQEIVSNVEDREHVRRILRGLVEECLNAGLLKAALAYLEKETLITDDPQVLAKIHLTAGTVFERMGDHDSAVQRYKAGLGLSKGDDHTWYFLHNNLGYCLNILGLFEEAEKYCRAAIEIDARRYNAFKNLGLSLVGLEKFPEAADCFIRAALMFPPDPRPIGHLEELLVNHREAVEREIPDISERLAAVVEARRRLMQ